MRLDRLGGDGRNGDLEGAHAHADAGQRARDNESHFIVL